jgi:hypothetical protein
MRFSAMLPADLLTKYGFQEAEALGIIEFAIARALTVALRKSLAVRIEDRLEITIFPDEGEPIELSLAIIKRKLRRHIIHQVELELQKRQVFREAEELKELRGKNVAGEISRIAEDGTLYVALEIADVFRHLILAGECPVRYQPTHERGRYRIGEIREFFISSVLPIVVNGRSAHVRIRLSRITKELPALLLTERTEVAGIVCRRRIAGGFSDIVTPVRIPKEAINSVGKELGEHLNVFISQASKR